MSEDLEIPKPFKTKAIVQQQSPSFYPKTEDKAPVHITVSNSNPTRDVIIAVAVACAGLITYAAWKKSQKGEDEGKQEEHPTDELVQDTQQIIDDTTQVKEQVELSTEEAQAAWDALMMEEWQTVYSKLTDTITDLLDAKIKIERLAIDAEIARTDAARKLCEDMEWLYHCGRQKTLCPSPSHDARLSHVNLVGNVSIDTIRYRNYTKWPATLPAKLASWPISEGNNWRVHDPIGPVLAGIKSIDDDWKYWRDNQPKFQLQHEGNIAELQVELNEWKALQGTIYTSVRDQYQQLRRAGYDMDDARKQLVTALESQRPQ